MFIIAMVNGLSILEMELGVKFLFGFFVTENNDLDVGCLRFSKEVSGLFKLEEIYVLDFLLENLKSELNAEVEGLISDEKEFYFYINRFINASLLKKFYCYFALSSKNNVVFLKDDNIDLVELYMMQQDGLLTYMKVGDGYALHLLPEHPQLAQVVRKECKLFLKEPLRRGRLGVKVLLRGYS